MCVGTREIERGLVHGRDALTSTALAAASLFASVVWFVLHDRSHANVVGTALVVAAALSMSWPGPAV
jgi:hypothetical protein